MNLKNILKNVFLGVMAVGVSAIYLKEISDRDIDMSTTNNHAAELDSAQSAYGPLFDRSEAFTLKNADIDSASASQLREKYGDKIGPNNIVLAEKLALNRKELENYIMPVYSEDYMDIQIQPKSFNDGFIENALKYVPKDIPCRFPDKLKELKQIEIPEEVKLIEINESKD